MHFRETFKTHGVVISPPLRFLVVVRSGPRANPTEFNRLFLSLPLLFLGLAPGESPRPAASRLLLTRRLLARTPCPLVLCGLGIRAITSKLDREAAQKPGHQHPAAHYANHLLNRLAMSSNPGLRESRCPPLPLPSDRRLPTRRR